MARTICSQYLSIRIPVDDNSSKLQEWYDYCKEYNCKVAESKLDCSICGKYVSALHIPTSCIYWDDCENNAKCNNEMAKTCPNYKEEQ